jgi:hypothetical protein
MKKSISLYGFIILALSIGSSAVFALPTITAATSQGTTIKFTATLSEKLLSGYKVKIDYGNGKGLVAMTCSGLTCTLSSNALPVGVSNASYQIGIYNAKGILQGTTTDGTYVTAPAQSTGYTKISNSGNELPDTALFGIAPDKWACTRDNKTGLTWEVKTSDGGLRDMSKTYTNYFLNATGYGSQTNSDVFVKKVNQQTLCGAANWRLPTIDELMTLVTVKCSDGKYETDGFCTNLDATSQPTINSTYFPNTWMGGYWSSTSSSSYVDNSTAWNVYFDYGESEYNHKTALSYSVRLVR